MKNLYRRNVFIKYYLCTLISFLIVFVCRLQAEPINEQYRCSRFPVLSLNEGIQENSFQFSSDGKIFAYAVVENGKYRVMWNNTMGEPYNEISALELSQSGLHLLYWGLKGTKLYLLYDHNAVGSWSGKTENDLNSCWSMISSNDRHWIAGESSRSGKSFLLVDGIVQPDFKITASAVLSKNGQSWGYIGLKKNGTVVQIVNGNEIGNFTDYRHSWLDNRLARMIIDDEGKIAAAVEPRPGGYQIRNGNDVIAKFGLVLYVTRTDLMFVQNSPEKANDSVEISKRFISLSSLQYNNGHIAWIQNVDGTSHSDSAVVQEVILDGKAIGPQNYPGMNSFLLQGALEFAPNGNAIAFIGRDEMQKWFVWSTKQFSSGYPYAYMLQWSLNGEHIAFKTMKESDGTKQWFYVVDNVPLSSYEDVHGGRFCADDSIFCYFYTKGEKLALVIDKIEHGSFDKLIAVSPPAERPDALLWYVVKEGSELVRLEINKTKPVK